MESYMISTKELAKRLGMTPEGLIKWRKQGKGPPYIKMVGKVVYKESDLDAWLKEQTVTPNG